MLLRGGEQAGRLMANAIGQGLQPQKSAEPVARHHRKQAQKNLLQTGGKWSVNILIHQAQSVKDRKCTQPGPAKRLRAAGQCLSGGEPEQRSEQDAEGVEEGSDHPLIVSRFGGKGNEEKFSLWTARDLNFTPVTSSVIHDW